MRRLTEVIVVIILTYVTNASETQNILACRAKLDLVIILDSSLSVGERNFGTVTASIGNLIQQLPVQPDGIRVGVVRYATNADVITFLDEAMEKREKITVVRSMPYKTGSTYTDRALALTRKSVLVPERGERPGVPDLVILITDGVSRNQRLTHKEASLLKENPHLKILSIGIGSYITGQELKAIASRPDMAFRLTDFSDFANIVGNLAKMFCSDIQEIRFTELKVVSSLEGASASTVIKHSSASSTSSTSLPKSTFLLTSFPPLDFSSSSLTPFIPSMVFTLEPSATQRQLTETVITDSLTQDTALQLTETIITDSLTQDTTLQLTETIITDSLSQDTALQLTETVITDSLSQDTALQLTETVITDSLTHSTALQLTETIITDSLTQDTTLQLTETIITDSLTQDTTLQLTETIITDSLTQDTTLQLTETIITDSLTQDTTLQLTETIITDSLSQDTALQLTETVITDSLTHSTALQLTETIITDSLSQDTALQLTETIITDSLSQDTAPQFAIDEGDTFSSYKFTSYGYSLPMETTQSADTGNVISSREIVQQHESSSEIMEIEEIKSTYMKTGSNSDSISLLPVINYSSVSLTSSSTPSSTSSSTSYADPAFLLTSFLPPVFQTTSPTPSPTSMLLTPESSETWRQSTESPATYGYTQEIVLFPPVEEDKLNICNLIRSSCSLPGQEASRSATAEGGNSFRKIERPQENIASPDGMKDERSAYLQIESSSRSDLISSVITPAFLTSSFASSTKSTLLSNVIPRVFLSTASTQRSGTMSLTQDSPAVWRQIAATWRQIAATWRHVAESATDHPVTQTLTHFSDDEEELNSYISVSPTRPMLEMAIKPTLLLTELLPPVFLTASLTPSPALVLLTPESLPTWRQSTESSTTGLFNQESRQFSLDKEEDYNLIRSTYSMPGHAAIRSLTAEGFISSRKIERPQKTTTRPEETKELESTYFQTGSSSDTDLTYFAVKDSSVFLTSSSSSSSSLSSSSSSSSPPPPSSSPSSSSSSSPSATPTRGLLPLVSLSASLTSSSTSTRLTKEHSTTWRQSTRAVTADLWSQETKYFTVNKKDTSSSATSTRSPSAQAVASAATRRAAPSSQNKRSKERRRKHKARRAKLDLVIIVDSSTSVGSRNFKKIIDFVGNLTAQLPVQPDGIRVALVRYSTHAEVITFLDEAMNKTEKIKAVRSMPYTLGLTNTNRALALTRKSVLVPERGERPGVRDLIILITDGVSTNQRLTQEEAFILKGNPHLKILSVGIGSYVTDKELKIISSRTDLIYKMTDFSDLVSIHEHLAEFFSSGKS